MSKQINLVMFGMSDYTNWLAGIENRNFQLVNELLKRDEIGHIFYIDYLPWTWKQAVKSGLSIFKSRLKSQKNTTYPTLTSRLVKYNDKLIVYSDCGYWLSKKAFYLYLKKQLAKQIGEDYLLWSYYPVDLDYLNELKPEMVIFDLVDNWAKHQSYQKVKDQLNRNYEEIVKKADLIFTVAEQFKNWLGNEAHIHWVPNGVQLEKFATPSTLINQDLAKIPEPRFGYVGTIQDRIDFNLVEYALQQHPSKSFVFIGPVWPSHKVITNRLLKTYPNFYALGRKSFAEAASYMQHLQVGIIPHTQGDWITYTDSTKLYEYLAAGLPVITTPAPNLEQFGSMIHIVKDKFEFSEKLDEVLQENSLAEKSARQAEAAKHHWSKRVDTMLQIIQKKLNER